MEIVQTATNELDNLLERWRRDTANPLPALNGIAELIERETEIYLKLPIDPFDDRHPSRTSPTCSLGALLKALFKNENFMSQLTTDYITSRNHELNVISCRLLLDILPGLDPVVVFMESESLVMQLLDWAERANFPLNYYATGLLGAAMAVDKYKKYSEQNNHLVPIMLNRLNEITPMTNEHFSILSSKTSSGIAATTTSSSNGTIGGVKRTHSEIDLEDDAANDHLLSTKTANLKHSHTNLVHRSPVHNECSSSSWAETYMSGSYQMHPLSVVMQQRFILQYLSALGEYQELLVHMFEHKALLYILRFIDERKNPDIRLAFDALKFLASFLGHKKFALEFIDHDGLSKLLRVKRYGMASSGVGLCLYYLAPNEDVMEKICWMHTHPTGLNDITNMIKYGLWLLECSHDSSREYASKFFSYCFRFPLLLRMFDEHAGLRKLLNVLTMRGLFDDEVSFHDLTDYELFSRTHTAKNVCMTLEKYTRAHFVAETRKFNRLNMQASEQECKPTSISDDEVMTAVELHRQQPIQRFNWRFVDRMIQEDGINSLLKIIAHICHEGEESKTVRSALDMLVVCSLYSRVQNILVRETVRTTMPYPIEHPALRIIMMCADDKIPDNADCQKSVLNILINFVNSNQQSRVPAPSLNVSLDNLESLKSTPGSSKKRVQAKNFIDTSQNLKKAIWSNNGTLILPKLLTITSPPTEADTIRSLTCRVLCGLAKEESIRQIMSKLPSFSDRQLQSLMKEPILPDKKSEFATFCKFCKELIELVNGTPVTVSGIEQAMVDARRRMVVAQTKIEYDRKEAFHLIYDFLKSEGLEDAATKVYEEAKLSPKPIGSVTLDSIFIEYLRNQHSLCNNPVATCPPFALLAPHRCPEPVNRHLAPHNMASRIRMRKIYPPKGGLNGAKYDRNYVYSKFRPVRVVRDSIELRSSSTCCAFSTDGQFLFVGTDGGMLKAYNIATGVVEASYECHMNDVGYIEASVDDNLLLTTAPDSPSPQCVLWTFTDVFERKLRFDNDIHAEFAKTSSDRMITTQELYARLWDISTGTIIQKYDSYCHYTCNRATMNYNDTLVLNDGVLWDVRFGSPLYKFQKLNERINGVFHPNGNEIICNSQIWDIRNYKLIKTVPAFDMCQLKFNSTGDVIFSTILDDQSEISTKTKNEFKTSFRTFDSHDYSTIATIDLKRTISDLAVSSGDEHLALVESINNPRGFQEEFITDTNVCRLYEIGKPRYDADIDMGEDDDEDEEDEEENDDDDDDDEDDEDDAGGLDVFDDDFEDIYSDEELEGVEGDESNSDSISSTSNATEMRDEIIPFSFHASDNEEVLTSDEDDASFAQ